MTVKLTYMTQDIPDEVGGHLEITGARFYKGVGIYRQFGDEEIIGRVVVDENNELDGYLNNFIAQGADGAGPVFRACIPEIDKNPQVKWWLLYNESAIWTQAVLNGFVDFNQELIRLFKERYPNKKIIVGAFNTGHPKMMSDPGGLEQLDIITQAFQGADGVSFHCYSPEDLMKDLKYHGCRYREVHRYCELMNRPHPPFFVLECGLDREGGPWHGHFGWQEIINNDWPRYKQMWLDYEIELRKDDYVVCATIYIAHGSYGWTGFELNGEQMIDLAHALAELPDPEPGPPPEEEITTIYLSRYQHFIPGTNTERPIDYAELFDNVDGVIIRSSVGNTKDAFMEEHVAMCQEYGKPWGFFHGLTADDDEQAKTFWEAVGDHAYPMGLYSDIEVAGLTREKVRDHINAADSRFGRKVGIYSNVANQSLLALIDPVGRDLWVADWGQDRTAPRIPSPFTTWEWWQYEGGHPFPGIPGNALRNRFNGTRMEFNEKYGIEEPEPGGNEVKYSINGTAITEAEFRSYFGESFMPAQNSSSEIMIKGLDAREGMMLTAYLLMADGSTPDLDAGSYWFALDIYGNEFRAGFKIVDGIAKAEWGMGHEGWPYHPESGEVGACTCYIEGPGVSDVSDEVTGCGYFASELGGHTHANLYFVMGEEPGPRPYTLTINVVPEGSGAVIIDKSGPYYEGEVVNLAAGAEVGWEFVEWVIGEYISTTNPLHLLITGDVHDIVVVVHFAEESELDIEAAIEAIKAADAHAEQLRAELARALEALGHEVS